MEQDFSQVLLCYSPRNESLPLERSLLLDTPLEQLLATGDGGRSNSYYSSSSELGGMPVFHHANIPTLSLCTSSVNSLADDEEIGKVFDSSEAFDLLGISDLASSWDDFAIEPGSNMQNIMTLMEQEQQEDLPLLSCNSEDLFDSTLPEPPGVINLDDIESILYGSVQLPIASNTTTPVLASHVPSIPTTTLSPSLSKPPITLASPCLQQLLNGTIEDNASSVTVGRKSDTSSSSLLLCSRQHQLIPVSEKEPKLVSPPKRAATAQVLTSPECSKSLTSPKKPKQTLADKPPVNRSSSSSSTDSKSERAETSYFWQYNMQSKGPKGQRLCHSLAAEDPHKLVSFEDPVFDPELNQWDLRHTGKARRGDGNDMSPNSYRLYQIGKELQQLNALLEGIAPDDELQPPGSELSRAKRAKNKLASRACRLKRKAQHEANKLKLYGLEQEHGQLLTVLDGVKEAARRYLQSGALDESLTGTFGRLVKQHLTVMIAGYTSQYVSTVLEQVTSGDKTGGVHQP